MITPNLSVQRERARGLHPDTGRIHLAMPAVDRRFASIQRKLFERPGGSGLAYVWTPEQRGTRVRWGMVSFARLTPGVTFVQAQQEMDVISDRLDLGDRLVGIDAPDLPLDDDGHLLLGSFGALAALLAAAGIYAVFSYAVHRRVQEIGLRIALGAGRDQVLRLIAGSALKLALAGLALGLAGTWVTGAAVASHLHGVRPHDPPTLALAALFMLAVAVLASWWPARRATRVDPMVALRQE